MPKILVAEDDKFLVKVYQAEFTKHHYQVKIAFDGKQVFEVLKTFQPDVILLDLIMPKKDGFEVLKELKRNDKYKNIPVIVATNLGQDSDINTAKKLGADDYIVKSDIQLYELVKKTESLFKRRVD